MARLSAHGLNYDKDKVKRSAIPDYQKKQALLYIQKSAPADLTAYGCLYLEAGRIADALDFFQAAADRSGLEKIKVWAENEGDGMAYLNAVKALQQEPTPDDWERIGRTALSKGKLIFARQAIAKSGNAALQEEIDRLLVEQTGN